MVAGDPDLLVLGDANPDLVLRGGDVVPAFGQAEHLVDDARLTIGGSGAILACGAAKLGLRVAIAAVVGDGLFGGSIRDGSPSTASTSPASTWMQMRRRGSRSCSRVPTTARS